MPMPGKCTSTSTTRASTGCARTRTHRLASSSAPRRTMRWCATPWMACRARCWPASIAWHCPTRNASPQRSSEPASYSRRARRIPSRSDRCFLLPSDPSRLRTWRLAVRQERLERPGRSGVELCPVELLLEAVKCLVADHALLAEPKQGQPLSRDRAQAEPVMLGRSLRLVQVRRHLVRGEVSLADG